MADFVVEEQGDLRAIGLSFDSPAYGGSEYGHVGEEEGEGGDSHGRGEFEGVEGEEEIEGELEEGEAEEVGEEVGVDFVVEGFDGREAFAEVFEGEEEDERENEDDVDAE